jgi:GNAT superfamily N-acetyltransferase
MVEIGVAGENQILDCMFVIRESHKALVEKEQFSARQIIPSFPQLAEEQKEGTLFCAMLGKMVLGTITLTQQNIQYDGALSDKWEEKGTPFLMIKRVAVHPSWQHKKVGSQLVEFAENYARDAGFSSIKIEIPEGFKVLEDFYQACVFLNRGTYTLTRSPYHVTILEKSI